MLPALALLALLPARRLDGHAGRARHARHRHRRRSLPGVGAHPRAARRSRIEFSLGPDSTGTVQALDTRRIADSPDTTGTEAIATYRLAAWDVGSQQIVIPDALVRLPSLATRPVPIAPTDGLRAPPRAGAEGQHTARPKSGATHLAGAGAVVVAMGRRGRGAGDPDVAPLVAHAPIATAGRPSGARSIPGRTD